jgi:deoxyribodipyrimidine photo-lyase
MLIDPPSACDLFPPTRTEGLRRLQAFLPRAGARYAAERNSDLGPQLRGNVSMLSPYLRHRLLTEFEVYLLT